LHPPEPDDSAVRYTAVWAKVQGPPWDMLSLGSDKELLSFLRSGRRARHAGLALAETGAPRRRISCR
jgi:hypothetical protein